MKSVEEKKLTRAARNSRYHQSTKRQISTLPLRMDHQMAEAIKEAAKESGLSINAYLNLYLLPLAKVIQEHQQQIFTSKSSKGLHTIFSQALVQYFSNTDTPSLCADEFDSLFEVKESG